MTYILLNCVFFVALGVVSLLVRSSVIWRAVAWGLVAVVALTAVFDPIMIALGLVAYDTSTLLGLNWFGAPIEDFAYALFAVPFVAAVWQLFGDRNA